MRKHERGRRTPGAALVLAAACGAMILALGGCGQSGPLHLPKKSSLAAGVAAPVTEPSTEPGAAAGEGGAGAARLVRA
jgi:predicted small lipoprotein YifL